MRSSTIILFIINFVIAVQCVHYEPNWKSLDARPLPKWYDQAKIGIFIHFGLFSVPSYVSEWFWDFWRDPSSPYVWQHAQLLRFMRDNFKPNFTYADFGNNFQAEFFNATHWAEVIKKSGARYTVLTTKHHEGFTLWPSSYSFQWNSMALGPKRDIVGEFSAAIRKIGNIHLGLYYSLFEWFHPLYLRDMEHNYTTHEYVRLKARPELEELINTYLPDLLWSDGDAVYNDTYWNSTDILAWLYNDSPVKDVIVTNDRWGTNCHNKHGGFFDGPDRNNPDSLPKHKWESAISVDQFAWGYRREASLDQLLTIDELIHQLLKTISFGGNFLVNAGPSKDGRIMPIFEERLSQLGEWLEINGDAIYESQIYEKCQISKNNQTFYTMKSDAIYGITLEWPHEGSLEFECIDYNDVDQVTMLGSSESIKFGPGSNGTLVKFPKWIPGDTLKYAYSFKFHV